MSAHISTKPISALESTPHVDMSAQISTELGSGGGRLGESVGRVDG